MPDTTRNTIRVFPRRTSFTPTDDMAFVGDPQLFLPPAKQVLVSCVFTWDLPEANRLQAAWAKHYRRVLIGGPAFDDPGKTFVPGQFVRPGVVFTSRGCPNRCPFCFVPTREGPLRLLPVTEGNMIADNNFLACPSAHQESVFDMLKRQTRVSFRGGLEAARFKPWHVDAMGELSLEDMWFAADRDNAATWREIERVAKLLTPFNGFHRRKKRCYVLVGYGDETPEQAEIRLKRVWDLGFLPFAQFYRGPGEQEKTREWSQMVRTWSRPAAMMAIHKAVNA